MEKFKEYLILEDINLAELSMTGVIRTGNNTPVSGEAKKFTKWYKIPDEITYLKKGDKIIVNDLKETDEIFYPVNVSQILNGIEYVSQGFHEITITNFGEISCKLKQIKE